MRRSFTVFAALALGAAALMAPAIASAQTAGRTGFRAAAFEGEWRLNPAGIWETYDGCLWAGSQGYLGGAWKEYKCEYVGLGYRMWIR